MSLQRSNRSHVDFIRLVAIAIGIAASASASSFAAPPIVQSTFDAGAESWANVDDSGINSIQWFPSGGVSGGYLRTSESGDSDTSYWSAPPSFVGDRSAGYGGTLTYWVRQANTSNQYQTFDIVLIGAGIELRFETSGSPGTDWTRFEVPLRESAGWRVGTLPGPPPTKEEFEQVLADVTTLKIRSEFRSGADTDDFDSVAIEGPECPSIAWQSESVVVDDGQSFTLGVVIGGSAEPSDLAFRWRRDGVLLEDGPGVVGSQSPVLHLGVATIDDVGNYVCEITSLCNVVSSDPINVSLACAGDIDRDGDVDASDLALLLGSWGCDY
jgi:Laminin B (Domain IV)